MKNARHGDLIFTKLNKLPNGLTKIKHNGEFILVRGEHTGHSHRVLTQKKTDVNFFRDNEGRYIMEVVKPVNLVHEEHKTITFTPGIYIQEQEQEFDYFTKSIKKVID